MGKNIIRGKSVQEQAVEILRNGGTLDDAAQATGFCRNYVRQLGVKEGIRFQRGKYKKKTTRRDLILDLYKQGTKPQEIAVKIGAKSPTTVYRALHECGIYHTKTIKHSCNEFRICKECGSVFTCNEKSNKRFCSEKCQKAENHRRNDSVRRARKRNALVDDDITLDKIVLRDNGICQLCGKKVDWNDYTVVKGKRCSFGRYPTIDHKVALANGGLHSWNNVQLAHFSCNSSKGVKKVV